MYFSNIYRIGILTYWMPTINGAQRCQMYEHIVERAVLRKNCRFWSFKIFPTRR